MVAAAWRGEISPRLLRVLIDGLGDDDPRKATNGHQYRLLEQLVWQLIGEVKRMTIQTSLSLGNKKVGTDVDHPATPWAPSEKKNIRRIGDRGDLTNQQVFSILDGLSIQGRQRRGQ
ncbi:hypothetical protein [Gordonia sp. SND2]|uniref:hypothetical protein n=1 Tax=Gordonia sp. SND2 TaxID=3388659 RepID=UPI00398B6ABA